MNQAALWKSNVGRADIKCKGPVVRVSLVCSQTSSACMPGVGERGGGGVLPALETRTAGEGGEAHCGWMTSMEN